MKKVIFFAITALVFTGFTSFKAAPPAVVTDTHVDVCGPFVDFLSCNGEIVTTTGCYSVDIHSVVNGNKANLSIHIQGHLDGLGDLGNEYEVTINQNQHQSISLQNGQANANLVFDVSFVSHGSAPNLTQRITQHITINANGVVTVANASSEVICNG